MCSTASGSVPGKQWPAARTDVSPEFARRYVRGTECTSELRDLRPSFLCCSWPWGLLLARSINPLKRREMITMKLLVEFFEPSGGMLVERHGLPWPSATPDETIATLRMPAGSAAKLRFQEIKPKAGMVGDGRRLVLHFNRLNAPDPNQDCAAVKEFETGEGGDGFTMSATFCKGDLWLVHSHTRVDADEQDWLAYFLTIQEFFAGMFPDS